MGPVGDTGSKSSLPVLGNDRDGERTSPVTGDSVQHIRSGGFATPAQVYVRSALQVVPALKSKYCVRSTSTSPAPMNGPAMRLVWRRMCT